MPKIKKLHLDNLDLTTDYLNNNILLLGCDTSFSMYQFAYHISDNLDIPLQYKWKKTSSKEKSTDASTIQSRQTLDLWDDTKEEGQEVIYYEHFHKKTQLNHYLYKNTSSLFQSSIAIKEYEFIRYWWVIKGDLTYAKAYFESIKQMTNDCPSIIFIELIDMNKMSEAPQCIFWEEHTT